MLMLFRDRICNAESGYLVFCEKMLKTAKKV